jgi:hypothetical protein
LQIEATICAYSSRALPEESTACMRYGLSLTAQLVNTFSPKVQEIGEIICENQIKPDWHSEIEAHETTNNQIIN